MSGMIRDEGSLLLRSVLWGVGLAALYDVLRILRDVIRHRQGIRSLEDLVYWCFTAFSLFWLLFSGNNGTVRWYILAGAGAGAWLYHITLSPFLVRLFGWLLWQILKILIFPVKKGFHLLKKAGKTLRMKGREKRNHGPGRSGRKRKDAQWQEETEKNDIKSRARL